MDSSLPGSCIHWILQATMLEWVAIFSSRGSFRPRDWTPVSHTAGRFFTSWATREARAPGDHSLITEASGKTKDASWSSWGLRVETSRKRTCQRLRGQRAWKEALPLPGWCVRDSPQVTLFSELAFPVRSLRARLFLSAFHSQCQSSDSQPLGLKGNRLDFFSSSSFQKMLSWLLGQMMIHWEQILAVKGRSWPFTSLSLNSWRAEGVCNAFPCWIVESDLCLRRGHRVRAAGPPSPRRGGYSEQLWHQVSWIGAHWSFSHAGSTPSQLKACYWKYNGVSYALD